MKSFFLLLLVALPLLVFSQDISFDAPADSFQIESISQEKIGIEKYIQEQAHIYEKASTPFTNDDQIINWLIDSLAQISESTKDDALNLKLTETQKSLPISSAISAEKQDSIQLKLDKIKKATVKAEKLRASKGSFDMRKLDTAFDEDSLELKMKKADQTLRSKASKSGIRRDSLKKRINKAEKLVKATKEVKKSDKKNKSESIDALVDEISPDSLQSKKLNRIDRYRELLKRDKKLKDEIFRNVILKDSLTTIAEKNKLIDSLKSQRKILNDKHRFLDSLNQARNDRLKEPYIGQINSSTLVYQLKEEIVQADTLLVLDSLQEVYEKTNLLKSKSKNLGNDKGEYIVSQMNGFLSDFFFEGIFDFSFDKNNDFSFAPAIGHTIGKNSALGAGLNTRVSLNKASNYIVLSGIRAFHKHNVVDNKFYTHTEITADIPKWSAEYEESDDQLNQTKYKLAIGGGYRLILYGDVGLDIQFQYTMLNIVGEHLSGPNKEDTPFKIRIGLKLN